MSYVDLTIIERLALSREAIGIVQNDEVLQERLAARGYTAVVLSDGLQKQEEAFRQHQHRQVVFGDGIAATAEVEKLEQVVRGVLNGHRRIAQIALQNQAGFYQQLRLAQPLGTKRTVLVSRAQHFYQQILDLPAMQALLDPLDLTVEAVTAHKARVDALEAAMQEQQHRRAEAEVKTRQRREAMAALDAWMLEFLGVARLVFKREPKQLKKLGLPV